MIVVLAIVGILLLLLFPAVQRSIAAARQTVCASNMRQCYLAVLSYGNDSDGALVPCLQYTTLTSSGSWIGNTWESTLQAGGYLPTNAAEYVCPSPASLITGNSATHYGMNCYLSPQRAPGDPTDPVYIRNIQNPSQRFLLIDNTEYATWSWYPLDYRHSGGANLCFMDGHIEWWKTAIPNPPPSPLPLPW